MTSKLDLRPTLDLLILELSTPIELFQNQTLRPVLKLQNDLYLALFKAYIVRQKTDFEALSKDKKRIFIEQSLQKDIVLKNTFIGITIGMFSSEELENYILENKEYNRRIISMLTERIKSYIK
ncbi:hypothetical protein [Kaistella jeonii]|uniref:Glyoxalase n=1 Tax=Kaistella jeonii TaxID=266749 RepID=A0A0C1FBF6_9FLAO|nr:hypothetical protein [Kaistella jeonii]KIA90447.1 hypothetical protein OA86_00660 [Kaistella jeonii]SFB72732.1 hypothetical protein SAMN05421876_101402 [Kaistella jeonii]VEI94989.1 Uncharacterised protein [Kaistella jeonii]